MEYQSRVFIVASADGGRTFTNQELVSTPDTTKPKAGTEAANPQFIFTQGGAVQASTFSYHGVTSSNFYFQTQCHSGEPRH